MVCSFSYGLCYCDYIHSRTHSNQERVLEWNTHSSKDNDAFSLLLAQSQTSFHPCTTLSSANTTENCCHTLQHTATAPCDMTHSHNHSHQLISQLNKYHWNCCNTLQDIATALRDMTHTHNHCHHIISELNKYYWTLLQHTDIYTYTYICMYIYIYIYILY